MKVRSFIATMGLGLVAGAATVLMIPKNSQVYRVADGAANTIKHEAEKVLDNIRMN